MKRIAVVSSIGLMVLLAACGGGGSKATNSPTPTATGSLVRLRSTGVLTIISPTPNEVITGSVLHVKLSLTGARVVSQTTTNVTPDTGHIHVSIDGMIRTFYSGVDYNADTSNLTPGLHLLSVEFVMADHVPFNPRVIEKQTFTVRK